MCQDDLLLLNHSKDLIPVVSQQQTHSSVGKLRALSDAVRQSDTFELTGDPAVIQLCSRQHKRMSPLVTPERKRRLISVKKKQKRISSILLLLSPSFPRKGNVDAIKGPSMRPRDITPRRTGQWERWRSSAAGCIHQETLSSWRRFKQFERFGVRTVSAGVRRVTCHGVTVSGPFIPLHCPRGPSPVCSLQM